jgi:predicted metalloprotease with PDZ domain
VYQVAPKVPTAGIENGGYRLGFTETKPELVGLGEKALKVATYMDTLGFRLNEDNVVKDPRDGSPAAKAGVTAGMKILAVDGRKMSSEVMSDTLARAKKDKRPIAILTELDGWYRTFEVAYSEGERFVTLERIEGKPDVLAQILAPHAR